MDTYMVEYTTNYGRTTEKILVSADTFTKAYMKALCALPKVAIILSVFKI